MTSYKSKAVKGASLIFIMLALSAVFSYLLRLLMSRKLPLEDYGLFFAMMALFQFLVIIRGFGLREGIAKYISEFLVKKEYGKIKASICSIFIIHGSLSVILTALSLVSAEFLQINYFHHALAAKAFAMLSIYFLISFVEDLFTYIFLGFQSMVLYSVLPFVRIASVFILTFFFIDKLGIFAPILAYILSYAFMPFIYLYFFLKKVFSGFFKVRSKMSKELLKTLIHYGFFFTLTTAGAVILSYTDTALLTLFSGLAAVGLYQAALPTATFLWFFAQAFATVLFPLSSELWAKKDIDRLKTGMQILHKNVFVLIVPISMMLFSFSDIALRILFGEDYVAAAPALMILSVGAIFYSIALINNNFLGGIGKPKITMQIVFLSAIMNIILNVLLIPPFNIIGAALATSSSFVFMLFLSTLKVKRFVPIKEPWLDWLKALFIGVLMVVVIGYVKQLLVLNVFLELIICGIIAVMIYIPLIFVFRLISMKEIKDLLFNIRG